MLRLAILHLVALALAGIVAQGSDEVANASDANTSDANTSDANVSDANVTATEDEGPTETLAIPVGCQPMRFLATGMQYGMCVPVNEDGRVRTDFNKKLAIVITSHYRTALAAEEPLTGYRLEAEQQLSDESGVPVSLRQLLSDRSWGTVVVTFDDPVDGSSWLLHGAPHYIEDIASIRSLYELTFQNALGEPCDHSAIKEVVVVGMGNFGGLLAAQVAERFGRQVDAAMAISSPVGTQPEWIGDYYGDALSLLSAFYPDVYDALMDLDSSMIPDGRSAFLNDASLRAMGAAALLETSAGLPDLGLLPLAQQYLPGWPSERSYAGRALAAMTGLKDAAMGTVRPEPAAPKAQAATTAAKRRPAKGTVAAAQPHAARLDAVVNLQLGQPTLLESIEDSIEDVGARSVTAIEDGLSYVAAPATDLVIPKSVAQRHGGGPHGCHDTCFASGGEGHKEVWNRKQLPCASVLPAHVCCSFAACSTCSGCPAAPEPPPLSRRRPSSSEPSSLPRPPSPTPAASSSQSSTASPSTSSTTSESVSASVSSTLSATPPPRAPPPPPPRAVDGAVNVLQVSAGEAGQPATVTSDAGLQTDAETGAVWSCADLSDYFSDYFLALSACKELVWTMSQVRMGAADQRTTQQVCGSRCFAEYTAWYSTYETTSCVSRGGRNLKPLDRPALWQKEVCATAVALLQVGEGTVDPSTVVPPLSDPSAGLKEAWTGFAARLPSWPISQPGTATNAALLPATTVAPIDVPPDRALQSMQQRAEDSISALVSRVGGMGVHLPPRLQAALSAPTPGSGVPEAAGAAGVRGSAALLLGHSAATMPVPAAVAVPPPPVPSTGQQAAAGGSAATTTGTGETPSGAPTTDTGALARAIEALDAADKTEAGHQEGGSAAPVNPDAEDPATGHRTPDAEPAAGGAATAEPHPQDMAATAQAIDALKAVEQEQAAQEERAEGVEEGAEGVEGAEGAEDATTQSTAGSASEQAQEAAGGEGAQGDDGSATAADGATEEQAQTNPAAAGGADTGGAAAGGATDEAVLQGETAAAADGAAASGAAEEEVAQAEAAAAATDDQPAEGQVQPPGAPEADEGAQGAQDELAPVEQGAGRDQAQQEAEQAEQAARVPDAPLESSRLEGPDPTGPAEPQGPSVGANDAVAAGAAAAAAADGGAEAGGAAMDGAPDDLAARPTYSQENRPKRAARPPLVREQRTGAVGPVEVRTSATGSLTIDQATSIPWTSYVLPRQELRDRLAAMIMEQETGDAGYPIDTFRDMMKALGKYDKDTMPSTAIINATGYVSDTLVPLMITALEYRTTYRLAVGGWPYSNLKTLFMGDTADVAVINNAVRRQTASAEAQHDQQALFALTGRPRRPVLLLCSDHDLTVPSFFCRGYAKAAAAAAAEATAAASAVEVRSGSQAVHLRFTSGELGGAVDRLIQLSSDERAARDAEGADVFVAPSYGSAGPVPSAVRPDRFNHKQTAKWRDELNARARRLLEREV